ncbi:DUF4937 domain-containing protein [Peribacillus muralis]|uniref:DUF4937 domain-containing protein n=1 Tax=Peribacillus muralis TaxID=264697 RepID=UPI0007111709|nr:DUF4937 domain-containing protein [Peribacillus muralis]
MLIKWITCQVDEKSILPVSEAQERWHDFKKTKGFLGQIGGWNKNKTYEANIISFWKDRYVYQHFMEQQHDEIFESSNQRNTYKKISVKIYDKMFDINSTDITEISGDGNLLRIADCCVHITKQLHFEKQKADSSGMLAGVFCKDAKRNDKYLVASLWENNQSHQRYVDNTIPSLIESSGVKGAAIRITENVIEINPKWVIE